MGTKCWVAAGLAAWLVKDFVCHSEPIRFAQGKLREESPEFVKESKPLAQSR
jgi:hypothetical protein